MTKLPKDLEALRDDLLEGTNPDEVGNRILCFNAGATAVLEHEQIKKLEAACAKLAELSHMPEHGMTHLTQVALILVILFIAMRLRY